MGINTGPIIATTELKLIPSPLTTVGYNSEATKGSVTNADDMPIFPMQYRISVAVLSANQLNYIEFTDRF